MSSRDDGARDERAERAQAEEQAWREIVDHYGDVPVVPDDLDDLDDLGLDVVEDPRDLASPPSRTPDLPGATDDTAPDETAPDDAPDAALPHAELPDPGPQPLGDPAEPAAEIFRFEPYDERFVPPPLPPPPDISTDRRFAWIGLIAPPVLLLIVVVLDYPLPGILTGALVVAFLASFAYLVATMSTEPRDPDDDGARL